MTGVVGLMFRRAGIAAQTSGMRFSAVDVAREALERLNAGWRDQRIESTLATLNATDLSSLVLAAGEGERSVSSTFVPKDAVADCEAMLAAESFRGRVATGVLAWMTGQSEMADAVSSFALVREILDRHGLGTDLLLEAETLRLEASPLGRPIDPGGEIIDEDDISGRSLLGRGPDIASHVGALRRALVRGEHYLVVGPSGGGKTAFIRRLAEDALRTFAREDTPRLSSLRFQHFDRRDLITSSEAAEENFAMIADMIEQGITPLIDDLDLVFSPDLPAGEAAMRAIGHEFVAGRRGFLLAAERGAAARLPFVNQIAPRSLPPLPSRIAQEVAAEHVTARIARDLALSLGEPADAVGAHAQKLAKKNYAGIAAPQGALRIIDGAIELARDRPSGGFSERNLADFVARDLNTPREIVERDGQTLFAMLTERLLGEVIAQDSAVRSIARAISYSEQTSVGNAPRARALLAGPPGVGKTYLARCLTEALGYDQEAFVMLNMSEYATEGARTRFIGADPGYVGFGHTRTIYDAVRARPSCVILLDEIDRAHPSIQDILLSILEGQGADATGRSVFFTQSVILATTNLGMEQIDAAWAAGQKKGLTRETVAEDLDDNTLRSLILHGAVDETERAMQALLDARVAAARSTFAAAKDTVEQERQIEVFIDASRRRAALEHTRRHSPLDRAFLDRIDVVAPFFPINTVEDVTRILDLELQRLGWPDCPEMNRNAIVEEVLAGGSVRAIRRLTKKAYEQKLTGHGGLDRGESDA